MKYIINPTKTCAKKDLFLLAFVLSAPENVDRRSAIRQTWANPLNFADVSVRVVFLLGVPATQMLQAVLDGEARRHGDIIQEDLVDSYRNLTRKVIGGLEWATTYCAHARFFAKVDDDIAVNVFKLMERLKTKTSENLLVCSYRYEAKIAHRGKKVSKWVVTREEYTNDKYPVYCSGWAYVMTPDVAIKLLHASRSIRYFWLEDVYVTGILAGAVGIRHDEFFDSRYDIKFFLNRNIKMSKWRKMIFGRSAIAADQIKIWKYVVAEQNRI